MSGMVAQAYNHTFGRKRLGGSRLESSPGKNVHVIPFQPMAGHSGARLSFQLNREAQIGGSWSRLAPGMKRDHSSKITNAKRAGHVAQAVECLLANVRLPVQTPHTAKKKLAYRNYSMLWLFWLYLWKCNFVSSDSNKNLVLYFACLCCFRFHFSSNYFLFHYIK
jgi:hypothetical protein